MNSNPNKLKPNKWLALINIPVQMGVLIFLFAYFGQWLDEKTNEKNALYTIVFSLISVFISLYNVIIQVKNLNKIE